MPSSAVATKTWFRPKGWFTDREVGIVVNRVLRDDPGKGDMHNREGITPKSLFKSLSDYDMWPVSIGVHSVSLWAIADMVHADLCSRLAMLYSHGHSTNVPHPIAPSIGLLDRTYEQIPLS